MISLARRQAKAVSDIFCLNRLKSVTKAVESVSNDLKTVHFSVLILMFEISNKRNNKVDEKQRIIASISLKRETKSDLPFLIQARSVCSRAHF